MKKTYAFLMALFFCVAAAAQGLLPEFSTEDNPVWYRVQFKTGSAFLTDKGNGAELQTAAGSSSDAQKWQLIGNKDNFKMKSKSGRYVNWNGSKYTASKTAGVALKIVQSTNASATNCWEIQRASGSQSMNQWGGAGAGKTLGEWTLGDANNPLSFVATAAKLPVFSSGDTEKWYFVQFRNGNRTLQANGLDECIRLAAPDPVDGQLWKLVGTADNFQLVNRAGQYAVVSNTAAATETPRNDTPLRASAKPYDKGFKLLETTNATYLPSWEIQPIGKSGKALNQWGGTAIGNSIGVWNTADNNNPLLFVSPDDMVYADFKAVGITGYAPEHKLTLWYDKPATLTGVGNVWMEYSLPIGNGQFGASLFGGLAKDEIQFNEKTLWSGRNTDNGGSYGYYENFGSVLAEDISGTFNYSSAGAAQDYYRQIDLTTATGKVSFKSPDKKVTYTREYFSSNPAGVIVARYAADKKGQLSLRFTLNPGKPGLSATAKYANGEAYFAGKLATVSYNARIKVVPTGGEMTTTDEGITVKNADEVLVVLAGGTDFDPASKTYVSNTAKLASSVQARINDAVETGFDALKKAHVADYQSFFNRVDFDLEGTANTIPTNTLVDSYNQGNGANARMLETLYFAYGRYLEISSSRGVDLPSNLQGIWNNVSQAPWHADIHSNINVQMNYWPAEPTNLSEMHLPFLNYIINMSAGIHNEWAGYAKAAGQKRGWTCYTENNIFGGVGSFAHNYVIANAWYCTHLWQHYRYTLDRDYLKRAFPAMLSAAQFWLDRLVLDKKDNTYVCPKEYSPEHGPGQEDGVAHAQQLVYDLLTNTKSAIEVLGSDAEISEADLNLLNDRLSKLDRGLATEQYTGAWGNPKNGVKSGELLLREWKTSAYTAGENGHRHMSHLMCVYPFNQVTPSSPYYQAAVNSMNVRGDESTGWSMGWKINLWARLQNGTKAHGILTKALRHSTSYGTDQSRGGIYYNLYDSHAPFQIDGNFGACSGIAEMLLQSHTDTIQVLPALPKAWKTGHVTGLKAIGNFTVSVAWKDGKATRITVVNNGGQKGIVKYPAIATAKQYVDGVASEAAAESENVVSISAEKGSVTVFDFDGTYDPTGIHNAKADAPVVATSGRTVSVSGCKVKSLEVYDLQGRLAGATSRASLSVGKGAGDVVIVCVTAKDGQKHTVKVKF